LPLLATLALALGPLLLVLLLLATLTLASVPTPHPSVLVPPGYPTANRSQYEHPLPPHLQSLLAIAGRCHCSPPDSV
jgi:hypothetical protein